MRFIYRKQLIQKIEEEIRKSKAAGRDILKVMVTPVEMEQLKKELDDFHFIFVRVQQNGTKIFPYMGVLVEEELFDDDTDGEVEDNLKMKDC